MRAISFLVNRRRKSLGGVIHNPATYAAGSPKSGLLTPNLNGVQMV